MNTKTCTKCNKEYPALSDHFHKMKNGKYGLRSICKYCSKIIAKKYRSTDRVKKRRRQTAALWRKKNPEKQLEISRKNYMLHGAEHNAKRKIRYKNDPEYRNKSIEYDRKYYKSGRRQEINHRPENMEKSRLKSIKRRSDPIKKEMDYKTTAIWRDENRKCIREEGKKRIKELEPSYVASCMRISIKDLTPEIIETKRIIIKIKRELKKQINYGN